MKKMLSLVLAIVMALSLWACGTDTPSVTAPSQTNTPTDHPTEPGTCPHQLEVVKTTYATCTKAGLIVSACPLCGEEFTEEIPAPGHNFTAASCTVGPICTVCGFSSGNALGHVYQDGVCIHCGDTLPQDVPSDCLHDYVLGKQTSPSCTTAGSMEYGCTKCGHTYVQSVAPTEHRYADATCTAPQTCILCRQPHGDALGHSYSSGLCTRCGAADPSAPKEVEYTVTIRSDKGAAVAGITVSIYTNSATPAAVGMTNAKGVATMTLMSAESYRVVLTNIPSGLTAKESYTFKSTRVNINLTTVSQVTPEDHSKANYKVGSTMGDFTLTDTDGNTYQLSQLLKEKDLVILNFWFVNCGPCKAEFPYFEAIDQKYDNVQLLTLNHIDSQKDIVALRDQMGVNFPMIAESIGLKQGFGIQAYPTTVFIAPSGKILKIQVGEFKNLAELEALIDSLI